jgi:hypothetical protein
MTICMGVPLSKKRVPCGAEWVVDIVLRAAQSASSVGTVNWVRSHKTTEAVGGLGI